MGAGEGGEKEPPFPNRLRYVREREKSWTREALSSVCRELHSENPLIYKTVSLTTLRVLEAGTSRPQLKTAATLAKALGKQPLELFPLGMDDPKRNPEGNTRISDRHKSTVPRSDNK